MKLSKTLSRLIAYVAPTLVLWVALVAQRIQVVRDTGFSMGDAFQAGLTAGLINDMAMSLLPALVAALADTILSKRTMIPWALVAALVWFSGMSNAAYFEFFQARLDLWVVKLHWRDGGDVSSSLIHTSSRFWMAVSTIAFVAALGLTLFSALRAPKLTRPPKSAPTAQRRLHVIAPVALMLALFLSTGAAAKEFGLRRNSTIITDTVMRWWWRQATHNFDYQAAPDPNWENRLATELADVDIPAARHTLAKYRAFRGDGAEQLTQAPEPTTDQPLIWSLPEPGEEQVALRKRLGLPVDGPINVMALFLESARAYELLSSELGPIIFPRLWDVLDRHGILFTQTYSSAQGTGMTVRGQFSTECSTLPNIGGAATYIAHTTLNTVCLPQLFKDAGTETIWLNSYYADFHRKRTFQMLHGMEKFYDEKYFSDRIDHHIGSWGLADGPFLLEVAKILGSRPVDSKPFYANVLTISTHHPFTVIPEGPLPAAIMEKYEDYDSYLGYLSRLRYLDESLGAFFEAWFQTPQASRTLIALLGDHGSTVMADKQVYPSVWNEIRFRIPMALITPSLPNPERLDHQVHQIDLAPTLATVAGLKGDVAWLGRGLFSEQGSPWVWRAKETVSYRTANRACYHRWSNDRTRCYDVTGRDPLFDSPLPTLERDPALEEFFSNVVSSNLTLIARNRLMERVVKGD